MNVSERLAHSLLSNPRADRVKAVAGLARRSARTARGLFLAEGPQNVREALMAHGRSGADSIPQLNAVYVTPSCMERHPDIAKLVEAVLEADSQLPRVFLRMVTDDVLQAMCATQNPQGAVAVCTIASPTVDAALRRVEDSGPTEPARLIAILCRLQDPGNAGAIIRAADAAGADAVVLTHGSVDVYNPKTVRSTAGSLFHLPVVTHADFSELVNATEVTGIQRLGADGYAELDLDVLQDSVAMGKSAPCDLTAPTAWLFGHEAQGLSEQEKSVTQRIAVPLYGQAESLNVATAAALCLYASARAQRRVLS
ncbi:MAG: RNA methyltransferase [Kocuria sp.]|nr:RNA methyltransferase [Kocuria sp.]